MQAVDPHHAPQRIDVEQRPLQAEPFLQREVEDADLGAAEQDPRDREEDAGITSGMIESAKNSVLTVVLVRSFITRAPFRSVNEKSDAPKANCSEFQKSRAVPPDPYAWT